MLNFNSLVLIICILLFGCSSKVQKTNKANYGLTILNNKNNYYATVKGDSSKKMVLLIDYVDNLVFDWKYATEDNFTKQILYTNPSAYMRLPAALALRAAGKELEQQGIGFKIFDAYRPYAITKKMWQVVPDERYAANPAKGSGHNRGAAIDLTLYNLSTGKELPMPTPFDDFTEKAHHDFTDLSLEVLQNRATLKNILVKHGFLPLATEWWHYYLPNSAQRFELMNFDFKQMKRIVE